MCIVLTVFSICFVQIFLGWCGDQKFVTAGVIYAICMGLCGIATACVPLFKSYVVGVLFVFSTVGNNFQETNYCS